MDLTSPDINAADTMLEYRTAVQGDFTLLETIWATRCTATRAATDQSIPADTVTVVTFDTADPDNPGTMWDAGQPTRITIPVTGIYDLEGEVPWDLNDTGRRSLTLLLGGATELAQHRADPRENASLAAFTMQVTRLSVSLTAADYIQLAVWQDTAGARDILASANPGPRLTVRRVG